MSTDNNLQDLKLFYKLIINNGVVFML